MKLRITFIIFFINIRVCQSVNYENYTLFAVIPTHKIHLDFLRILEDDNYKEYLIWKPSYRMFDTAHVLVSPRNVEFFKEKVFRLHLMTETLIENVQEALENQTVADYTRFNPENFTWDHYYRLEDIYQWMSDLNYKYPNTTSMELIGKTAEKHDMFVFAVKIAEYPEESVFVEAGLHGNEWVTIASVTYLIDHLLRENTKSLLNYQLHWYMLPVANPDGYRYTHTTDRMWRKNRKVHDDGIGVDLNRNFGHSFGKHGTIKNPKNNYYCGPHAFSEPETAAIANFIERLNDKLKIKYYFSIHAYGQKIMIPYGDKNQHLDNFFETEKFARKAKAAMYSSYYRNYSVGTAFEVMGSKISGDSSSWAKSTYGISYVYTFLLSDNGTFGHALPSTMIKNVSEELLLGVTKLMAVKPRFIQTDFYSIDHASIVRPSAMLFLNQLIAQYLK